MTIVSKLLLVYTHILNQQIAMHLLQYTVRRLKQWTSRGSPYPEDGKRKEKTFLQTLINHVLVAAGWAWVAGKKSFPAAGPREL